MVPLPVREDGVSAAGGVGFIVRLASGERENTVTYLGPVLAAVDLGSGAHIVMRFAALLAEAAGTELIAVHIIAPEEQEERAQRPGESQFVDVMIKDTSRILQDLADATRTNDLPTRCIARVGEPVDEVRAIADETGSGLIVVGKRRRSRVGKFLLGSDLQEILLYSDLPVVAVPIGPDGA